MLEMTSTFTRRWDAHGRYFMPGLNDFQHRMQVVTHPAIYWSFLTEKTPENAKLIDKSNNLAWCIELVTPGHEKNGDI
jgi:hypothetical protein